MSPFNQPKGMVAYGDMKVMLIKSNSEYLIKRPEKRVFCFKQLNLLPNVSD